MLNKQELTKDIEILGYIFHIYIYKLWSYKQSI